MTNMLKMPVTRRTFIALGGLAACAVLLGACSDAGGPEQPPAPTTGPDPDETAVPTPDGKPTPTLEVGVVALEVDTASGPTDNKYIQQALEAPAGAKIKLKFNNMTNSKDEVGHNWVLVKPGQEDSVVANGFAAGDVRDWLDKQDPGIIAHTRLIEGAESDTITFDVPAPGMYTFLSTFPGQYKAGMKGTLTIK
jgi:azurin